MQCGGCKAEVGERERFCGVCGMPQNPQKREGHQGLDAAKFAPSSAAPPASSSSSSSSSSSGSGGGGGGGTVVGKYEYVKPGSGGDKSTKWLTLNQDGSAVYLEKGETSLESFEISGRGRWQVSGGSVEIQFPQLQKQNKLKRSVLVPGMGDSHVTVNDGFDIDVEKLVNAPSHGVHKWKRV